MSDDMGFEVPEVNRIGSLMRDLFDDSPKDSKSKVRTKSVTKKIILGRVLISDFVENVNWRNIDQFTSPLSPPPSPTRRLGSLTVATYASGINWRNVADGPSLAVASFQPTDVAPDTVTSFMDGFSWD